MTRTDLTPDQRADADRIHAALISAAATDLRTLAELLAATDDRTIFGSTEFAVRDIVLRVGAKAIEAALAERKKRGTTVAAGPVRTATKRPSSSAGSSDPS